MTGKCVQCMVIMQKEPDVTRSECQFGVDRAICGVRKLDVFISFSCVDCYANDMVVSRIVVI